MNTESRTHESYPIGTVVLSCGHAVAIYGVGAYILSGLGLPFAALYLLYVLWCEVSVLRGSCVHCHYHGKRCGLGKGKLCALLLRRGQPEKFSQRAVSWRDVLPDMMVLFFPLAGGIVLLLQSFEWSRVLLLALLVLLSFGGNALVRGSFVCKYCRQRELGCPAERLFGGKTA